MSDKESTDVGLAVIQGQVVMRFDWPVDHVVLDPQNAFTIAEQMARHAHEARFGEKVQGDASYIGEQVRARITEDIRNAMITRATKVMRDLVEMKTTPAHAAAKIVDVILSQAQGRVVQ